MKASNRGKIRIHADELNFRDGPNKFFIWAHSLPAYVGVFIAAHIYVDGEDDDEIPIVVNNLDDFLAMNLLITKTPKTRYEFYIDMRTPSNLEREGEPYVIVMVSNNAIGYFQSMADRFSV